MITKLKGKKSIALLLDPDKASANKLEALLKVARDCRTDYIFVGGSMTFNHPDKLIAQVKSICDIPVILFPGNLLQLTTKVDAILFLSLISGRNPELLIGNQVLAAPSLKNIKSRVSPVGYMLINCGARTSVEYMSQTEAIPSSKTDIAVATALAGEMLGLKLIYLEAGSGADHPVPAGMISSVKENISIPLLVGGGLRSAGSIRTAYDSGADIVVLGNGCENDPSLLEDACRIRNEFK